jgi:hypothetical protein
MYLCFDFIILLTGQSNALGIGGYIDQNNINDQPDPRIWGYVSNKDYWTVFDLRIQIGSKKNNHKCLAFNYAKKLLELYPHWKIGIIICGLSDQSISRWVKPYTCNCKEKHLQNGTKKSNDVGDIFDLSVLMSRLALNKTSNENINLIIWQQGEADYLETMSWYYQRLAKVIRQYWEVFSDVQFICAQLFINNISDTMNKLFETELSWMYLKLEQISNDNIHYSDFKLRLPTNKINIVNYK